MTFKKESIIIIEYEVCNIELIQLKWFIIHTPVSVNFSRLNLSFEIS